MCFLYYPTCYVHTPLTLWPLYLYILTHHNSTRWKQFLLSSKNTFTGWFIQEQQLFLSKGTHGIVMTYNQEKLRRFRDEEERAQRKQGGTYWSCFPSLWVRCEFASSTCEWTNNYSGKTMRSNSFRLSQHHGWILLKKTKVPCGRESNNCVDITISFEKYLKRFGIVGNPCIYYAN